MGIEELMPYAKGVGVKTHKFDANGNETKIDFQRVCNIIRNSGFNAVVGIEYEGGLMHAQGLEGYLSNEEGINATKKLIEQSV